jgi:hypothetical protein
VPKITDIVVANVYLYIRTFFEIPIKISDDLIQNRTSYQTMFQHGECTPHTVSNRHPFNLPDQLNEQGVIIPWWRQMAIFATWLAQPVEQTVGVGGPSQKTIAELGYASTTITFARSVNLKEMSTIRVDKDTFICAHNVRSFFEGAEFKIRKGSKAFDVHIIFDHNLGEKPHQPTGKAKAKTPKTPVIVVSDEEEEEEEEEEDSDVDTTDPDMPDLGDESDDEVEAYEKHALKVRITKERYRRETRDRVSDGIKGENLMVGGQERSQGEQASIDAQSSFDENIQVENGEGLFVSGSEVDNHDPTPPSTQAKLPVGVYNDDNDDTATLAELADQQLHAEAAVEHTTPVTKRKQAPINHLPKTRFGKKTKR